MLRVKRAHPRWGKEKISLYLGMRGVTISGKTVWKIFMKHRLIIRYHTKKAKIPKPRLNWAEIHLPGHLLEMDTKVVNLHGRRVCQYTIIDVVSGWRYADIYPAMTAENTIAFLAKALRGSKLSVKRIQTDNGHEFQRVVTTWLKTHGIRHLYTHKARPIENSHVERSHRIDEEEFYSLKQLWDHSERTTN